MNYSTAFERLGIIAEVTFNDAFTEEFYGIYLFDTSEQEYYRFARDEKGDSVWLAPDKSGETPYKVIRVKEDEKYPFGSVVPGRLFFRHCETISIDWLEDRRVQNIG